MNLQYTSIDIFPTRVMKFLVKDLIAGSDVELMIQDIDSMIREDRHMQNTPLTPRYQSMPVLFNENFMQKQHWNKLARTFIDCCYIYTQQTQDFIRQPDKMELTGVRGWFFKSQRSINHTQDAPWHDHSPALLTGVFYLRVPGDHTREGGTMFRDPRGAGSCVSRDVEITPDELSWVIFPGWLGHCAHVCDTEDPRYVVAADCYVKVRS